MPTLSMSAFRGKADIRWTSHECPLMTHSGHRVSIVKAESRSYFLAED